MSRYEAPLVDAVCAPTVVFETERLTARRVDWRDIGAACSVYGDPQVVRWLADGRPFDRWRCEEWIEVARREYAKRGYGMVALREQMSKEIIGFCGLVPSRGQPEVELAVALHRECWGKGYASEAAVALLTYGERSLGLTEVSATTAPANTAAQRVLLKAGMSFGACRANPDGSLSQMFSWRR